MPAREEAGRGAYREAFDAAVARAVAPLNVLCELMLPLVRVGGRVLALKGPGAAAELEAAQTALETLGGRCLEVAEARVAGRNWAHTLAVLERPRPRRKSIPGGWESPKSAPCKGLLPGRRSSRRLMRANRAAGKSPAAHFENALRNAFTAVSLAAAAELRGFAPSARVGKCRKFSPCERIFFLYGLLSRAIAWNVPRHA